MIPRRVPKTGEAKFVTFGNRLLPNQEILPEDLPEAILETEPAAAANAQKAGDESSVVSDKAPNKWLTLVIVGLILTGILLGAGAATLWITRFSPQLRH